MSESLFEVNAIDLHTCLVEDLKVGLVPMVTSSPGVGKSDIIRAIAKEFILMEIDLRVSQCEPVDMQGFPGVIDGRMTFHVPEYFPIEGDPLPPLPAHMWKDPKVPEYYRGWLLFLDEFNSGNKQTEAAAYKLILDKAVYKHKLHPLCAIIAAGNKSTDRAIVNTMSTATTSRLIHYRLKVDHLVWIAWANENGIDHRIISLIKYKPALLHNFDPDTSEMTFSCPRTLAFASKVIAGVSIIDKLTKTRLAGTIGEGAAVELATYSLIYKDLPTIEQILADPVAGWKVPTEPDRQYAITTMLAHNINMTNVDTIITAIGRLPMEFQVITFKDIYKCAPEMRKHPYIEKWIADNASKMFGN